MDFSLPEVHPAIARVAEKTQPRMAGIKSFFLGPDPTPVILIKTVPVEVKAHWEQGDIDSPGDGADAIVGYVRCFRSGCPYCDQAADPKTIYILPIFVPKWRRVMALQVHASSAVGSLQKILQEVVPNMNQKTQMLVLSRDKYLREDYVEIRDKPSPKLGDSAIDEFLKAYKANNGKRESKELDALLTSIIPQYTIDYLCSKLRWVRELYPMYIADDEPEIDISVEGSDDEEDM